MNLINKIFNRKIAGDTSNIVLPDATGIDSGIEYKSAVNSNVPNGLFNHISDAIQYLQFSVGLYSNTAQYTEGNICKVITKENGHYQIRVFRRNGNNAGATVANPPVPTNKTTTNGIDCYEVENETEWNTDWDECETGLAYWEFKIEGKTITEATQSFDNRDSVGATWTKAHIQELYDSVRNFRVVYYYNCLITTHNIVKEGNVIKGSFSFENIARYTMKFEYNLDANSFTSCSCNIFHYNTSIKELDSDQLYNSVKGNVLKVGHFSNIRLPNMDLNQTGLFTYSINIKTLLNLNYSIQGFDIRHVGGMIGNASGSFYSFNSDNNTTTAVQTYSTLNNVMYSNYMSIFFNNNSSTVQSLSIGEYQYTYQNNINVKLYIYYSFLGDTLNIKIANFSSQHISEKGVLNLFNTQAWLSKRMVTQNNIEFDFLVYYFEV